ncbi:MAG TPA: periplasmic heavy metal sensor [Chthoniobacterales bacterium]|nr:periplasmic heavy metal sensor [Chthoniobacterales bacterium]
MKKLNAWLAILFLCCAPFAVASAQWHGCGEGGFLGGFGRETLEDLDLSETQRQQVHQLLQSNHDAFRSAFKSVLEAHRDLNSAMQASAPDEATIRARTTQLGNALANLAVLKTQIRTKIVALLDASQQQKLAQSEQDQAKRTQRMIDRMSQPGESDNQ